MKPMSARSWAIGGGTGIAVGFVVALTMTFADWRVNPSGIFHGDSGTNWGVTMETALSWFLPVAFSAFVMATAAHYWFSGRWRS